MRDGDSRIALGNDLDFLRELWALDHALQTLSKRMERTLGVSGPQRWALRLVGRFPGLPAGRLAHLLHLHPSTVSGLVKRLADHGLIARSSDGPDRRRRQLRITPKGVDLLRHSQPTVESAVVAALHGLSGREVATAIQVLAMVATSLDAARAQRKGSLEP